MGRSAEGWKLRWRDGIGHVRFRHEGTRHEISTESRDPGEAAKQAARIYAETVSGRRRKVAARVVSLIALDELVADWIADFESDHDRTTTATYLGYFRATVIPHFEKLERFTSESIADYSRGRLRSVIRKTVQKERGSIRSFLEWCKEKNYLDEVPVFPAMPRRATGTRSRPQREAVKVTEAEVFAFLAALPEWSTGRGPDAYGRFPVRAFFEALYFTTLRPETLRSLRAPGDYRVGSSELRIRDEADKARFGRTLDLDARATAALDSVCPEVGAIFGRHDYRVYVEAAAKAALPADKAATFVPYDLRHARARHMLARSPNLIGVAYLMGHKHLTTTNMYLEGNREEGAKVLAANVAANGGTPPESPDPGVPGRASAGSETQETPSEASDEGSDAAFRFRWGNSRRGSSPLLRTDAAESAPESPPNAGEATGAGAPPPVARSAAYLALLRGTEGAFDLFVADAHGVDVPGSDGDR